MPIADVNIDKITIRAHSECTPMFIAAFYINDAANKQRYAYDILYNIFYALYAWISGYNYDYCD